MKKFEIVCNAGSTSGGGHIQREIKIEISAELMDEARIIFDENPENKIYGRRIISIREIQQKGKSC